MILRNALLLLAILIPATWAAAQSLEIGDPAAAGFDPGRLQRIDAAIERAVDAGEIPGAVALIARDGTIAYYKSFGFADLASGKSMQVDSIFRIASMTKAITTVGAMILYERGYLLLTDPLSDFVPEFANAQVVADVDEAGNMVESRPAAGEIRVIDLLTHRSGIGYPFLPSAVSRSYSRAGVIDGFTAKEIDLESNVRRIAEQPLLFEPGSAYAYGLSTDVLGHVIEVATGETLDEFFRNEIFEPLGMNDTHFYLPPPKEERLVTLYADTGSGLSPARGDEGDIVLDDPNYPVEGARAHFSGGAGLSSTAMDYARFLQMLLNEGRLEGRRLLSRKSVDLMRTAHVDRDGDGKLDFGFGFGVVDSLHGQTELATPGAYSWGGAFYTYFWIDPGERLVAVLMSQVRPADTKIRELFNVLMYQALD